MATKPTVLRTWATNVGTRLAPSGGQQAAGWAQGDKPPARVVNDLEGHTWDWLAYLEDNQFQRGTGAAFDFDDDVNFQLGVTVAGEVDTNTLLVNTSAQFDGPGIFNDEIYHGPRIITISGISFDQGTGTANPNAQVAITNNFRYAPLLLKTGDRVTDMTVGAIRQSGSGNLTIGIKEANLDIDLGVTDFQTVIDPFDVTWTTVTGGSINLTLAALKAYSVFIESTDWTGFVSGVEITFDRPSP